MVTANGRPWRSTTMWRFVPNLPRLVGSLPLASPPRSGHTRAIEGCSCPVDVSHVLQSLQERVMQAPPHACALPVTQPPPARHAAPAAQLLGQHLPGDATFQDKDNAGQGGAICNHAWSSALGLGWLRGQQGRDDLPQHVTDLWRTRAANLPHGIGSVRRT